MQMTASSRAREFWAACQRVALTAENQSEFIDVTRAVLASLQTIAERFVQ